MNNAAVPLKQCVLEEIALDGLDGITFEGFWRRLAIRMKLLIPLNGQLMTNVWNFIKSQRCIQYYELPEERECIKIFDRNDFIEPDTGMPIEPDECPFNNYKSNPISKDGIRGSCEDFDTRIEIPQSSLQQMTHVEAEEKWGRKLVMVASQQLRESILIPPTIYLDTDLTLLQYCILERVGRSRYNGEATQGKWSLCDIVRDSVTFHYLRKRLVKYGLIERQVFYLLVSGANLSGQLLHLPRFYVEYKPRHASIMEKIVEYLKQKPIHMAEFNEIKQLLDTTSSMCFKRLLKNSFFQKFISHDIVPYRTLYPNASEREWKIQSKSAERSIHVLRLRDPNIDLHIMHPVDEDDDDEGDDNDGLLGDTNEVLEIPLSIQIYEFIKSTEENGVSEAEIGVKFGQSKLSRRLILKNILREKILTYYVNDQGRQKVRKYVALEYGKPRTKEEMSEDEDFESGNEPEENIQSQNTNLTLNDEPGDDRSEAMETESVAESTTTTESAEPVSPLKKKSIQILESDVAVEITELQKTEYCMRSKRPPLDESNLTDKMKYRSILIQRAVRANGMLEEPTKLYNLILRDEKRRGFKDCMCKKTFFRLLTRLCSQKRIRLWQIHFRYEHKFRSMMYITDKKIDSNYSMMKSCIEQAKARFVLTIHNEQSRKRSAQHTAQKAKIKEATTRAAIEAAAVIPLRVNMTKRMNYGNTPKFVRMRTLHDFLYYLVYDYNNDPNRQVVEPISQHDAIEHWKQNESFVVDYDELSDLPTIYTKNIEWKMFVSPLIPHQGYEKGWCLLGDCIYRMPLSIFIKICNVNYEIEGLDEFLSHPIKRHYLIHSLPIQFQHALFIRRKYIFSIDDMLKRLCFLGLAQSGPHRLNNKDQAFYYLNKRATLWNTVSSAPGYYYISKQEYPAQSYEFRSCMDIFQYWDDMYTICMNTKLNRRALRGRMPVFKTAWHSDRMAKYVKVIDPHTAEENDKGILPGDHMGAAGLDSSFFAHLVRNWSFKTVRIKQKIQSKSTNIPGIPMHYNRFVRKHDEKRQKRGIVLKPMHKLVGTVRRRAVRKRVTGGGGGAGAGAGGKKQRARNRYDDVDRTALRQMSKLRVDWSPKEDNFLILCRVAYMYLSPTGRPMMPITVIRDLLHWSCGSLNKTSQACKRRLGYIMKQPSNKGKVRSSIFSCLGEVKENKMINKRFGRDFTKKLRKLYPKMDDFLQAYKIHFVDLVHMLNSLYSNLTSSAEVNYTELPDSLAEFRKKFSEKPEIDDFNELRYEQPTSKEDVEVMTIVTLIHSTMCCARDKTSQSIQLYEVYKDFQEKLLQLAMQKVRSNQFISQNKVLNQNHMEKDQLRILPLTANPYHLSITYQSLMFTKISYDLFDDAFGRLMDIANSNSKTQQHQFSVLNSNTCFFLAELLHREFIEVCIEIPNRILVLDPQQNLCTDQYPLSIYSRFKDIFKYIPKVDLMEIEQNYVGSKALESHDTPSTSKQTETNYLTEKLESVTKDQNLIHFFCIVNCCGQSKNVSEIKLVDNEKCSFDCFRNHENVSDQIMKCLLMHREIWSRINADEQIIEKLPPNVIEISETNIVSIYNYLLSSENKISTDLVDKQREIFRQFLDVVEATLAEEEKQDGEVVLANENDEMKGEFKKIWQIGDHLNEKIHKFHDFLYVNACKLSVGSNQERDETCSSLIEQCCEKRNLILKQIVEDAHWTNSQSANADFDNKMAEHQFSPNEIEVGIDVFNFIEAQREVGATASLLMKTYGERNFLQNILDILIDVKLIMRTGVCEFTYVHWTYVKQWLVNTYHLKRIERESVQPNNLSMMEISDSTSTPRELKTKRKSDESNDEINTEFDSKRTRLTQEASEPQPSTSQVTEDATIPESSSARELPKRLAKKAIARDKEVPMEVMHPKKTTFTIKMAPWIRVNGSLNRRVLDKYLGTILLYCVENPGLTIYKLCTRFYFLTPVHVRELVQYLEDMDCVKTMIILKRKPITLFSTYEHMKTAPPTQLDSFENIVIEVTIDAVTRMSTFIGDRKYKEDFI